MYMFMDFFAYVNNVCLYLQKVPWDRVYIQICSQKQQCTGNRFLPNPENLVTEATRNSLRDLKIKNFPGVAYPQTP